MRWKLGQSAVFRLRAETNKITRERAYVIVAGVSAIASAVSAVADAIR